MERDPSDADRSLLDLLPLDDDQAALLRVIWSPFRNNDGPWPLWGWVRIQFEATRPGRSAYRTMLSLPTLRPAYSGAPVYRLWWQDRSHQNIEPLANEQVGLTISGLVYLGRLIPNFGTAVVNRFLQVLADLSMMESARKITATEIPVTRHRLKDFVDALAAWDLHKTWAIGVDDVAQVLGREYGSPIQLFKERDHWTVTFEGFNRMGAGYAGLHDGDDYIRLLATLDRQENGAPPVSDSLVPVGLYDSGGTDAPEWHRIDSLVRVLTIKLEASTTVAQWKEVGLACTEILIELGKAVQDADYLPARVQPPKAGDAKQWITYFLLSKGVREEMKGFISKTWELSQNVKHGTDLTDTDAFAASQATIAIVRTVQRAGRRHT